MACAFTGAFVSSYCYTGWFSRSDLSTWFLVLLPLEYRHFRSHFQLRTSNIFVHTRCHDNLKAIIQAEKSIKIAAGRIVLTLPLSCVRAQPKTLISCHAQYSTVVLFQILLGIFNNKLALNINSLPRFQTGPWAQLCCTPAFSLGCWAILITINLRWLRLSFRVVRNAQLWDLRMFVTHSASSVIV